MDTLLQPPHLTRGMRVAVIAPAGAVLERARVETGRAVLEQLGLQVCYGAHLFDVHGGFAGTDEQRADDLAWALRAPEIDAVWCARGGFGSHRTVGALRARWDVPTASHTKAFVGFSDLTVIHHYIARVYGWVTFYGPTVDTLGTATDYTLMMLRRALFVTSRFTIASPRDLPAPSTLAPGVAEAPLAGGCLELLAMLVGSDLSPKFDGKIVFFEDVATVVPRIDRRLAQLTAAGCFRGAAGFLVGEHAESAQSQADSAALRELFGDYFGGLGVPCLYGIPLGHGLHQATLPVGTPCRLDADHGFLTILRPGVR